MNPSRRLFSYAWDFKRTILVGLTLLALSVVADLTGPFVAKAMINQHIVGIERVWYQTTPHVGRAVEYHGQWFSRGDALAPNLRHGNAITLQQLGRSFYVIQGVLPSASHAVVHNGVAEVTVSGKTLTAPATALSTQQLFAFYQPEIAGLWHLALLYFALIMVSAALTYQQTLMLQIAANRVLQRMRRDVFAQIQRLPIRYFDAIPAGKIVSRVTNDTEAIRDFYVNVMATVVSSAVTMIGIYVAMFILDVHLALLCLVLLPIMVAWLYLYRKFAVTINHRIRAILSDINGMLNETIQGIPIIRAFHRQARTYDEFQAQNEAYYQGQTRLLAINSATGYNLTALLRHTFQALLIAYFGARALHLSNLVSFGVLYAFIDYLGRLFQPVQNVVNQLSNLEQARVAAERVFELMDEPGIDVADGVMPRYEGNVVFEDVSFAYDDKNDVLRGISFTAKKGQTVALVGHTGSGKSSIMNLLFRFYDPHHGTIRIDDIDIRTIPRQHVRQHMGIVLQDPFLFTGTIGTNVSLEDPRVTAERVNSALVEVGADQLLGHLPNGWDEPVLEKGSTLSSGQRQLISFARALAFNPAILVLDEATSSIDTETETVIQAALDVLKRGRTTFIIAHRLSTIRNADLILVLDRGTIVERGTHDELMALGGRYYGMYQLQQGVSAPNPA